MLKCIAFVLVFTPIFTSEARIEKNPIFEQVVKNHPKIDRRYALKVATAIQKVAKEMGIRPERLAAILAQESMYRLNATNHETQDYAIGQINIKTIKNFNFDKNRLLTDLEYSIWASGLVLHDFKKRYGKKEKNYWSRYNSSNKSNRKVYEQLVARYEL